MPYTSRTELLSAPKTSRNNSYAASATFGWSKKSPDVAHDAEPHDARDTPERSEMLLRDRQSVERREARRRSTLSCVEFSVEATAVFRLVAKHW
jgi:hypothetical protein